MQAARHAAAYHFSSRFSGPIQGGFRLPLQGCRHHMDIFLLQAIYLRHPFRRNVRVGGIDHQCDTGALQLLQLKLQLLIGVIADHKACRKAAEVGKIQQLLPLGGKTGLHLQGRHRHAVGQQQIAVADQHPAAVHPGGKAPALFAGHAFHRFQILFVGDHSPEDAGQRIIGTAQHAGSVQDRLVNRLLFEGTDAVQRNAAGREQIAAPQQDAVGIVQLFYRILIQQVGAPAAQCLVGAAQRHMAAQRGGQRRRDTQRRGKDGDRLKDAAVNQQIIQHRHGNGRQDGNGRQHPADALGLTGLLQHRLGILRQTGGIQRHRFFRLLRQPLGPFGQPALRQGAAGHRPQRRHRPAAFPLTGILHQLAPGIKEQDRRRQRQVDIIAVLLQQLRLRRHKAALQQAGKNGKGHIGIVALPAGEQRQEAVAQRAAAAERRNGGKGDHSPQAHRRGGCQKAGQQQMIRRRQRQIQYPQQDQQVQDQRDRQSPLSLFQRLHQRLGGLAGCGAFPHRAGLLFRDRDFLRRRSRLFFRFLRFRHSAPGGRVPLRLRYRGLRQLRLLPAEQLLLRFGGSRSRCDPAQQLLRGRFRRLFRRAGFCGLSLGCSSRLGVTGRPFRPFSLFTYLPQDIVYIIAVFCHCSFPPLSFCPPALPGLELHFLPGDLVQDYAARHRGIERIDLSAHRQRGHKIALLLYQPADAVALGADHQSDRTAKVEGAPILSVHIGTGKPDVFFLLKPLHGGGDIGHPHHRQADRRPGGSLDCRSGKPCAVPLGDNDPVRPAGFRRADDRPQVVRILDVIADHHKKGLLPRAGVNILHFGIGRRRADGRHALVRLDAGKLGQLFAGSLFDRDPPLPGLVQDRAHRSPGAAGLYVDALQLPAGTQRLQHRVPSGQYLICFLRGSFFLHRIFLSALFRAAGPRLSRAPHGAPAGRAGPRPQAADGRPRRGRPVRGPNCAARFVPFTGTV